MRFSKHRTSRRWQKLCFAASRPLALWRARQHLKRVRRQLACYDIRRVLNFPHEKPLPVDPEHVELLYQLAARGLRHCRCLPQSVAVFQNLRARGVAVRHVIGVNPAHRHGQKLWAHAWVERNDIGGHWD